MITFVHNLHSIVFLCKVYLKIEMKKTREHHEKKKRD